jgi:hypothetical protein
VRPIQSPYPHSRTNILPPQGTSPLSAQLRSLLSTTRSRTLHVSTPQYSVRLLAHSPATARH